MKKPKNTYANGPWLMKKSESKSFVQVTNGNRRACMWTPQNVPIYGRIFYVIDRIGNDHKFRGTMVLEPRFTAGWWKIPFRPWINGYPGHHPVKFEQDMGYTEWAQSNKVLFDKLINENSLFIKPTDPILTFIKD